jgi:PII-like signaling protein
MVDASTEPSLDELFLHNALACETVVVMRVFFYRGEVVIDNSAPIFKKKKLLKDYLIESAKEMGISSALHHEFISGYQDYQTIHANESEWHFNNAISCIDLVDYKARIGKFCCHNFAVLSKHMIMYEEKKRIFLSENSKPHFSSEQLRVC